MRFVQILLLISSICCGTGCHAGMTGKVIDATTQQPIVGAVVLVEWLKTSGYPFSATKSVKAVEILSDKDGKVELPGISDPFVQPPDITVYKQGYVAWNNRFIFPPGYTKRTDFALKDGYVFRLERFKPEYTYRDHTSFIYSAMGTGNIEHKQLLYKAFDWERVNSNNEMIKLIEINKLNK